MIGLPETLTRPVRVSSETGPQVSSDWAWPVGAAQQRADPRQYLLEVERLGDIVVGAGVKALHLVAPAVAGGQDQDRHRAAVAAPGFQHRDAVHLRQADVEHHGIVGLAVAEEMALLAVEGAIDHIAGVGQRRRQLTIEIRVIFNNEQAQAGLQP